ncbi:hypothetical protein [Hungatella hathewayi]|uniref:hypothetical protein n=1 Tax=Hungatella hathewayi TaxID=154046 RepID=UPI003567CB44
MGKGFAFNGIILAIALLLPPAIYAALYMLFGEALTRVDMLKATALILILILSTGILICKFWKIMHTRITN